MVFLASNGNLFALGIARMEMAKIMCLQLLLDWCYI